MIKRLLSSVREYKKDSILTPIFVTLVVIMEVTIPLLMAKLIDNGINTGDMDYIYKIGGVLVLACIVALIFGILGGKYGARASAGLARNLRKDMYYNVQNFSFSNIDKFSTSSIITRLTTDITNIQMAYQMIIRVAVRAPLMLVFALIMAYSINPTLTLVFLSIIPFLAIGLYIIIKNAHPIFERVFKTYDKLNNVVQENLNGIRVVKTFVREDYEIKKFDKVSGKIYEDFSKATKLIALNMPLMQTAIYACILLISWLGAHMIVSSTMTTGELMSMISYAAQILMSLMMLSMILVIITISRASAERAVEILNEKSDLSNPKEPIYKVKNGDISFENVNFCYSKKSNNLSLKNINVSIRSGETIGIIGGTGSSKTTFVQLIPRLYDAISGSVKVGGVDVRNYDIESLRNQVAMVLQNNTLFSGTIKDNLRWGNKDATDEQLIKASKLAQADEFIQTFPEGYDTYIEQGGTNVSGGQKQRLCIARALLKDPKILILDDSTSAVDTKTDALIRQAFREEIPHTTKIIIAQRIASVQDADKIIVFDNGEINAIGTHEELMETCDIYREVNDSQMKGDGSDAE